MIAHCDFLAGGALIGALLGLAIAGGLTALIAFDKVHTFVKNNKET